MINDPMQSFNDQWMVYDYWQHADNPDIRLDAKYDVGNVRIRDKMLQLQQLGYTSKDEKKGHHVSMAGLQTRRQDIMQGTFRTIFKVEGATGGSCAAFFWHRDDDSELDIEAITKGNSLVNNTINYTTHPSLNANGTAIPDATLSVPLSEKYNTDLEVFHEHRFDSDRSGGASYYIDGELMHIDGRRVPKLGGNLQLKLWADGNKWWSGYPSSTTVTMSVKSIIAYFNTTGTVDGTDQEWFDICEKAGGPSDDTVCEAYAQVGSVSATMAAASESPTQSPTCLTKVGMGGTCLPTSQAARKQPVVLASLRQFFEKTLSGLGARSASGVRRNASNEWADEECCYNCYRISERDQRLFQSFESMDGHVYQEDHHTTVIVESPSFRGPLKTSNGTMSRKELCCFPCTTSQAVRHQPFGLGIVSHVRTCLSRLRARFPLAARGSIDFSLGDHTQEGTQESLPLDPGKADQGLNKPAIRRSPQETPSQVGIIPPLVVPSTTSQGFRNVPLTWSSAQKYFKEKIQKLSSRDEPTYSLPFGSPVEDDDDDDEANATASKSQGARVRLPFWFNTLYARNSTPVAYKSKQIPVVRNLEPASPELKELAGSEDVKGCKQDRNAHCSFGQVLDIGNWWSCLRKRSDWCFFFSGSSFLLTNGLIQVLSVPLMFAFVFYMTEG